MVGKKLACSGLSDVLLKAELIGSSGSVLIVGRICNNFEKNRAFYDKSMKLGTWLVDSKTKKKGQCHAKNAL